jgi:hypothetical protein
MPGPRTPFSLLRQKPRQMMKAWEASQAFIICRADRNRALAIGECSPKSCPCSRQTNDKAREASRALSFVGLTVPDSETYLSHVSRHAYRF